MRFEKPERGTEKNPELARQYLEQLAPLLEKEGEALRQKGFPVNPADCRLAMEKAQDIRRVEQKESQFVKGTPEVIIGELLETSKTLALNQLWFGKRFISVRASKFDDYFNGVDELIFDTETFQPLAAVDMTTNPLGSSGKKQEIIEKVSRGGEVKYGVALSEKGITKTSYEGLPLFIITIEPKKLLGLSEDILNGSLSADGKILESEIVNSLKTQSEQFQNLAPLNVRLAYKKTAEIFRQLWTMKNPS